MQQGDNHAVVVPFERGIALRRQALELESGPGDGEADVMVPFRLACTPLARLRGLTAYPDWCGILVLTSCNDVHTMGLCRPIDVAFVDAEGVVVEEFRDVRPWQRRWCFRARATLERWAQPEEPWFRQGDYAGIGVLSR